MAYTDRGLSHLDDTNPTYIFDYIHLLSDPVYLLFSRRLPLYTSCTLYYVHCIYNYSDCRKYSTCG